MGKKTTQRLHAEALAKLPPWSADPLARLEHTLAAHTSPERDDMAIWATMTSHPAPGTPDRTGITWGDLDALAAELAAHRRTIALIRAADPDLFDPTDHARGAAYETYGSAGRDLREEYLAAVTEIERLNMPRYNAGRDHEGYIRLDNGRGLLVALNSDTRADVQAWRDKATDPKFIAQYDAALKLFDAEEADRG